MRLKALLFAWLVLLGALSTAGGSDPPASDFSGMVWTKLGDWHLNGSSSVLRLGEAMPPGGLLTAGEGSGAHSIVILLPDGQRMLCECYEAQTCAQGFRIPAITPAPGPEVWDMFVGVRNALLLRPATAAKAFPTAAGRAAMAANFETVVPITPQGEISIAPVLRVLPSGRYSLNVTVDGAQAAALAGPAVQTLDWTAGQPAARVRVGAPGLYRIRVSDQTSVPRMEIEVLATSPASLTAEAAGLRHARETIQNWNHIHGGWDLHDFLRVYLQSRTSLYQSRIAPSAAFPLQPTFSAASLCPHHS